MEETKGMLSGGDVEQAKIYVDRVTVSDEMNGRVVSALVVIGVGGLSEGTGVSVREGTIVGVILTEVISVASEVVRIESLWRDTESVIVEAV